MANYRTEVSIPVARDARTFEQRRKDMLSNLERSHNSQIKSETFASPVGSDTSASSLLTDASGNRIQRYSDDWDDEVNRWISRTRREWNDHMKSMRQSMFELEPVDEFDLDNWGKFGHMGALEPLDDPSSMMEQMERRMQSLRQKMDSMSTFGPSPFASPGGTSIQTSSSRISTSSSTSSSGDPRGKVTKSNVVESTQHTRTINGETTSTSSHSATSSSNTGVDGDRSHHSGTPGTLIPQNSVTGGVMDFLKDAYELGDDGQVHFKVRFDAKNFAPEDIDVTTVDNRLTVHAKKSMNTGSSKSSREFCRTIDLPRSIDHEHFQCHLTEDGVLILDAPVKAPDYKAITFTEDRQLGIRPRSESEIKANSNSASPVSLTVTGHSGPTILKDGANGRKLHLEVTIDPIYKSDELCVRVDANRIIVSGKHEKRSDCSSDSSTPVAEFSKSYEIPETVDPFSVSAQLIGTSLVIEAPLLCTV